MQCRSLLFCIVAAGMSGGAALFGAESGTPQAVGVVSGRVQLVKATDPKRYVGCVEAIEEVKIVPRVTGELRRICFREGTIVRKGELLYEIEDTAYRAAVAGLHAQKEQLTAALNYATAEYNRSTRLLESKAVAVSAHDKALMEIAMAKAKIKEIDASLIDAENNLSYTRIHAPITGRVGKSAITTGNLLTPAGGSIADITQLAPIYVRFNLSESVFRRDFHGLENLKKNAVIRLQLADGSLFNETGRVVLMDNKVSSSTDTVTLWAVFPNAAAEPVLIPGGFVTVLVQLQPEKPLPAVIPSALMMEDNGYCVYVLDNQNRVERRSVTPGGQAGELRIITSGLTGDERIVVDGTHKVRPGITVSPVPAESLQHPQGGAPNHVR